MWSGQGTGQLCSSGVVGLQTEVGQQREQSRAVSAGQLQPSCAALLPPATAQLRVPLQPVLGLLSWLNPLGVVMFRAFECSRLDGQPHEDECHHLHNCNDFFFFLTRVVTRKPWFGTWGLDSVCSHLKPTIQISTVSGQCVSGRGHVCSVEQCADSISEVWSHPSNVMFWSSFTCAQILSKWRCFCLWFRRCHGMLILQPNLEKFYCFPSQIFLKD